MTPPPSRVPVGLIVEGRTEYEAFESLVRRMFDAPHGRIPLSNANGNGTLRKRLEYFLSDMTKTDHPYTILVCLDSREALEEGAAPSCVELAAELISRSTDWIAGATAAVLQPKPHRIGVVLQHPTLEAWIWAGLPSLPAHKRLTHGANEDLCHQDHATQLEMVLTGYVKKPATAVPLLRVLDPAVMHRHSRSFRKFVAELCRAYELWSGETGQLYQTALCA